MRDSADVRDISCERHADERLVRVLLPDVATAFRWRLFHGLRPSRRPDRNRHWLAGAAIEPLADGIVRYRGRGFADGRLCVADELLVAGRSFAGGHLLDDDTGRDRAVGGAFMVAASADRAKVDERARCVGCQRAGLVQEAEIPDRGSAGASGSRQDLFRQCRCVEGQPPAVGGQATHVTRDTSPPRRHATIGTTRLSPGAP